MERDKEPSTRTPEAVRDQTPSTARPETVTLSRDLLAKVRARDSGALGVFFEECFPEVYSLAFRLTGDRPLAEDVTQEVFLKVYRAAHKLDPDRDPRPWLASIVYNACRDHWRSWGHKLKTKSGELDEAAAARHPELASPGGPEKDLLRQEEEQQVQNALGKLPEDSRTVVVLRDYEGLPYSEISEILGITSGAARKRYSRALTELGQLLEGTR